jgi:hypothetical protein
MKKYILATILGMMVLTTISTAEAYELYTSTVRTVQTPNTAIPDIDNRPCYFVYLPQGLWLAIRKDGPYYEEIKEQVLLGFTLGATMKFGVENATDYACSELKEIQYCNIISQ